MLCKCDLISFSGEACERLWLHFTVREVEAMETVNAKDQRAGDSKSWDWKQMSVEPSHPSQLTAEGGVMGST